MSGATDPQFATKADLAQLATKAEVQALELKLQDQMLALKTGSRGATGADIKRNLNRHTVAASVVAGVVGILLVRDDEIAAWLREVVPRFFA